MLTLLKNDLRLLICCALFLGAVLFTHAEYRNVDLTAECIKTHATLTPTSVLLHSSWLFSQSLLLGLSFYVVVFVERYWAPYMWPEISTQRILWLSLVIGAGGIICGTHLPDQERNLLRVWIYLGGMGAIGVLFWFLLSVSLLWNERSKLRFHLADLLILTVYSGIGVALTQLAPPDYTRVIFLGAWFLNAFFSFLAYTLTRNTQKFWLPVMLAVGFFMFPAYWVLLVALQPQSKKSEDDQGSTTSPAIAAPDPLGK